MGVRLRARGAARETSRAEEHRRWRVDSSRPRTGSNKITHPAAPLPSCSRLTTEIPARPQSHLRSAFASAPALASALCFAFEFTCSGNPSIVAWHSPRSLPHTPPLLPPAILLPPPSRQSAVFVSVDPSCSPSFVSRTSRTLPCLAFPGLTSSRATTPFHPPAAPLLALPSGTVPLQRARAATGVVPCLVPSVAAAPNN